MKRDHLTLVTPQCPPCHGDCDQGDTCPVFVAARAQAVARAAEASERAKRAREMRDYYKPSPWWARVDWLRILETWGAGLIFVAVLALGSALDIPRM